MTEAEKTLWRHLKRIPLRDTHFRRQVPIGPYIGDFVCHQARLVIELDGGSTDSQDGASPRMRTRTAWLERQGYRVLRFWNY